MTGVLSESILSEEQLTQLSRTDQILFLRSIILGQYSKSSDRMQAFDLLNKLIGEQTDNNARYIIVVKPYVADKKESKK